MLCKKIKGITAVFTICALFTAVAMNVSHLFVLGTSSAGVRYILDAGHGLPDGGAVGVDGAAGREMNLALIKKLSALLEQSSIAHILTRSDESSIYTEGNTIHAKKVSDIKQRITIANDNAEIPIISIHMNSFPDSTVHGIQVFYNEGNVQAKQIADALQAEFNTVIQPNNIKAVKTISKNVYLFSNISNPSILIECGFVSNREELNKLKTEEYQAEIANVIGKVLIGRN